MFTIVVGSGSSESFYLHLHVFTPLEILSILFCNLDSYSTKIVNSKLSQHQNPSSIPRGSPPLPGRGPTDRFHPTPVTLPVHLVSRHCVVTTRCLVGTISTQVGSITVINHHLLLQLGQEY